MTLKRRLLPSIFTFSYVSGEEDENLLSNFDKELKNKKTTKPIVGALAFRLNEWPRPKG